MCQLVIGVALIAACNTAAQAQSADNLLLVVNTSSPDSVQVAEYYARKRSVGADRILEIQVEPADQISRTVYAGKIEAPIAAWLNRHALHDRILYIVLTKGVPLRIAGNTGRTGTVSSVDSELALLYRRMTGQPIPPQGFVPNPYFLADGPIAEAKHFSHQTHDIFLVTRLDGFTVGDVAALIDRGLTPAQTGRIALDEKASIVTNVGNRWLERSAELLRGMGLEDRVVLETTGRVLTDQSDLLGYYSFGSNDPAIHSRDQKLSFVPGALAATFVSTDGRTFKEPPPTWTVGTWEDATTYFEGSPQSLIGDLVRQGVTGAAGHVAEPFLDATIRPDILFPAYLSGFNLAESFYLALPYLGWQTVVIGDPLVAPFRQRQLAAPEIDGGLEATTGLPSYFSERAETLLGVRVPHRDVARSMLLG